MIKLSRRRLARYTAEQLVNGTDRRDLIAHLAAYLVTNKLDKQVELFTRDVATILAAEHGAVLAEVISARELSAELKTAISGFVQRTQSAKSVELVIRVDKSLIGGVIIRTPSGELDTTIKSQLKALRV